MIVHIIKGITYFLNFGGAGRFFTHLDRARLAIWLVGKWQLHVYCTDI